MNRDISLYHELGYVVVNLEVTHELCDAIVRDVEPLYRTPRETKGEMVFDQRRVQNAWRVSENVRSLVLWPQALALLEELYGRRPKPFQTLNFPVGTEQPTHSDSVHFNSWPPTFMCGFWWALENMDATNGPLLFYPGSHHLREEDMFTIYANPLEVSYADRQKGYEDRIKSIVEREGLVPALGTINKGEAILWASNLLHGGSPQTDRGRTRHSQVNHYFFEGTQYLVPIKMQKKIPVWVE